jgi:hypothetical protein
MLSLSKYEARNTSSFDRLRMRCYGSGSLALATLSLREREI